MMYEDAGCAFPCGAEPMGCGTCPDFGRTVPYTKDTAMDNMRFIEEELGIDMDDPYFDEVMHMMEG